MIGSNIFFLDTKDFEIKEGILIGVNLSTTGYVLFSLLTDDKKLNIEEAHCFMTREEAEAHKVRVMPVINEAELEKDAITKVIDEKRIFVIGEPRFKELADRITGGN